MKHFFTVMLFATAMFAKAQYVTPGTGVRWDLDSLVTYSAGVVSVNGDHYDINGNVTISASDTLEILYNTTVVLYDLSYLQSSGRFVVDAPDQVLFTALDSLSVNKWRGFKFLEGHETFIRNAVIEYGGGIKVNSGGTFHIENSTLQRNYYKSGSTSGSFSSAAVLDITGAADIINNRIIYNQRGAVASGANTDTPANIRNNYIFGNTVENSNRPQINMGPAGEGGVTYIVGNTVTGNGATNAGGIAYASLMGIPGDVVIDSNVVVNNRYGITITGSGMNAQIRYNTLTGNNIQNNPDLGGSGLNFTASSSSSYQHVMVTGNNISGSLWGITIIGYPVVNMGNNDPADYNPGLNIFSNNGNNGILYDLYNNGPLTQNAMGNYWGVDVQDAASIESVIVHQPDVATLGLVNYMPASQNVTFTVTDLQMNPLQGATITINGYATPLTTNAEGIATAMIMQGTYDFNVALDGYSTTSSTFTLEGTALNIPVILNDAVYTLTFNVTDGSLPVAGATVNVGDFQITTGSNGLAYIGILPGTYNYTVTKEGFETANGSVTIINQPVTENVVLTAIIPVYTYTVTFTVTSDGEPAEGATVLIADSILLTNAEGIATIDLINGVYPYTVTGPYADTLSGVVTVADEDVNVEAGLTTGVSTIDGDNFRVYPNPASTYVNVEGASISKVTICNLKGKVMMDVTNPQTRIELNNLPSGFYLMKIYSKNTTSISRLIVK